jgi:glucuronate isomerase
MRFFDKKLFLNTKTAEKIYSAVKDLPIIDYHCHLDQKVIASNEGFSDIGELWLKADHYKWRSMRLCGVEEYYITGKASYKEKFLQYAKIMPKLVGSPLYYWTHMELRAVFGITLPLGEDTAEEIYREVDQ